MKDPIQAEWQSPRVAGGRGQLVQWTFPCNAVISGFEVIPTREFTGYITVLRIANVEYLRITPYPISMFAPGQPPIELWLPYVPFESYLIVGLDGFSGQIRPKGLLVNPLLPT